MQLTLEKIKSGIYKIYKAQKEINQKIWQKRNVQILIQNSKSGILMKARNENETKEMVL